MIRSRQGPSNLIHRRLRVRRLVRLGLLFLCFAAAGISRSCRSESDFSFNSPGPYRVNRVVDADTLLLEGGIRVRLIGVDTPETTDPHRAPDALGLAADQFVRKHVEGHDVTLKFDRERRDRYRRVLAYVYVGDWFLNEELIAAGFSRAQTRFPYSTIMKKRFREAEGKSRNAGKGMWAKKQKSD